MSGRCAMLPLVAVMLAPVAVFGAPGPSALGQRPKASPATHAVQGIVKAIDHASLVITRSPKKASNLSFVLTPSTLRAGIVEVGATVAVRYYIESRVCVATAVTARKPSGRGRAADNQRRLTHAA